MAVLDDLAVVGAPVTDPVALARWLAALPLAGPQQARLLRQYLAERGEPLTRAVLVAARDYSFEL